ncbi:DNA polymerase I [Faecalibacterium duncaniae]|uniref:DNA polymerase I n=1 Tax=Faecalibacterium duncaniae (strain DSM 17677 / JCM 31915 / A2-165) TaxID=411483 RepID=UPI0029401A81|nr:DNA polymerase I [Faecalibacterium duncaniae]MDV5041124.1 DNA polymerase I [Faecalibacterium duncaniae]
MRLLVIDGNSIANRAFYGIKLLTTKDGRYTNAIFGFLNIMNSLLRECEPDEVAVAFDLKHPTFRHEMYDGYKGTRHAMPDELAQQMPILKELLTDLGYRQVSAKGWEADDILGTLAAACEARRDDCFLATGDRDSLQLVSETTTVLLATSAMGRSKTETMDLDAIHEKYGIEPKQLIEVKSLMGDTSDNIPGVKGIGEKTAMTLVKNFGTLDSVYDHLDSPIIKPRQRENLLACREDAYLSHTLGTIRTDAPIDTAEGAYKVTEGNKPAAVRLMQELEIQTLITRFGLDGIVPEQDPDTLPEVDAAIASLPAEPSGHYLVAARPAVLGKKSVIVQPEAWYAVQDTTVYPLSEEELVSLLDDPKVTLDVFDSAPLYARAMAAGSWGSSIVWDGKLAAYLLDASASHYLLTTLATSYHARSAFSCEEYPDAGFLADLFARMKAEITENGEDKLYNNIEFPLAQVLADMTRTGILVDREGIEAFGVQLRQELDQVLTRIEMEAGTSGFNPNSPKQLGTLLFDTMGLPHGKKTKNGWSTDAETLEKLRDIPLVEDILQYRACQKLNSTYVEGLLKVIGEDGRIHTRFNQTEARTGRLSSDNPNLQNIPIRTEMGSKLRAYFVAKPGCVLVDADYSQIELRILAHVTGDAHMQEAFLSGADIHRSTAAKIYNIRPEDVTPRLRSSAKAINFGIMYGKGAYSLSKDIGVSVKEAEAFLQTYLATFPNIDGYMEKTIADARQCGYVSTLFGRRRALPELNSNNHNIRASGERMARNTPIQGTAADVIKLAMVRVWRRLRDEKMESRLILTVHDELIVEAPEAEAEKAAQILREEMEGCVHYAVPLSTDVHTGKNWLEAH